MLGRTDVGALFFDGAKVPSMTAVSHCNRRRSSNFAMNACQIRRQVPSLSSASVGASWWTGFGTPRADRATVRRSSAPFFMDHVEQEHETVRRMPCTGALAWMPKEIRSIAELCSGEQAHSFVRGLTLCHTDALVRTLARGAILWWSTASFANPELSLSTVAPFPSRPAQTGAPLPTRAAWWRKTSSAPDRP